MLRTPTLLLATATVLLASPAGAADELLPRPENLDVNVRFWTRIYAEVDAAGGVVHDARHLDVVYEVVRLPSGLPRRAQERRIEKVKRRIVGVLKQLARGKRTDLSDEEASVLGRWPPGVSNETLRTAARSVRFQLGQADRFRAGLVRAGAWRDYIEQTLDANGVPRELAVLPHVESSYDAEAYSRVGAAGLWQFTRSTGRLFLRIDHVVDERLDARKASVAAAKLLQGNYAKLGTWPLAITAYNHGVAGIARAVRKLGTTDIATISQHYDGRTFGFASRNFYAEFLAALEVDRNAERYFGPIHADLPREIEAVVLDHFYTPATLERAFAVDLTTLRAYNPSLRPAVWNGTKYVPRGYALALPPTALSRPPAEVLASIPASERKTEQHRDRYYKVRRGDTLSKIARNYSVREHEIVVANNLRSRHQIRAGQVLVLPDRASGGQTTVARSAPPADGFYRVRRGDTLSIIAQRFGVSERALAVENDLRDRNHIAVGQRLRIPGAPTVVVASAESEPPAEEKAAAPVADEAEEASATPPVATEGALQDGVPAIPESGGLMVASAPPGRANYPPNVSAPDPSDYAVGSDGRITVQAAETLGHYAEWLEVQTSRLRQLNGMNYDTPVSIGRKVKLDFSRVTPKTFEERRLGHHHALQEEYFAAFEVIGTSTHTLRPGETLWYLAERKYEVPVWLIRQFNPDLDFGALEAGIRLIIPEIGPRTS